jgi:hypothetical protein
VKARCTDCVSSKFIVLTVIMIRNTAVIATVGGSGRGVELPKGCA